MSETEIKTNGDRILKNLIFLTDSTGNLNRLTLIFVQNGILDPNERERIISNNTEMDRASEMYLQLIKKVTDEVFAQVLQALNATGNSHVADKLVVKAAAENEITTALENVHINDSYEVAGQKNNHLVWKDVKIANPGFLTKIIFTFVEVTRRDIVDGFKHCQQLESLLLKDVYIYGSKGLNPATNNRYGERVLLPALKRFIWEEGKISIPEPYSSQAREFSIKDLIFFHKIKDEKHWEIEDINSLQMNVFEMTYIDDSEVKRFIKINNIERSFQCLLEAGVDAITTTLPYPTPVKLYLENCTVSLSRLPMGNNLKELTIWYVSFQDRKSVEMNHDFFKHCQELVSLRFGGKFSEAVLDVSSLPPNLKVLELNGIAVKYIEHFSVVYHNLYKLKLCSVRFINSNNENISPQTLELNKLMELNIIYLESSSEYVIIDWNSLQKNLRKLSLSSVFILRSMSDNLLFAEQLVELKLILANFVVNDNVLISKNGDWMQQFKNLKLLLITRISNLSHVLMCSTIYNTLDITVDWKYFPPSLTTLTLHNITVDLDLENDMEQIPQTGNKFGSNLKELLFQDCVFTYEGIESMTLRQLWRCNELWVQKFRKLMTQSYLKGSDRLKYYTFFSDFSSFSAHYKLPKEISTPTMG